MFSSSSNSEKSRLNCKALSLFILDQGNCNTTLRLTTSTCSLRTVQYYRLAHGSCPIPIVWRSKKGIAALKHWKNSVDLFLLSYQGERITFPSSNLFKSSRNEKKKDLSRDRGLSEDDQNLPKTRAQQSNVQCHVLQKWQTLEQY